MAFTLAAAGALAGGQLVSGLFGGIFGAKSAKKAAKVIANAMIKATQMQLDALDRVKNLIMTTLDPSSLQNTVLKQDIENIKARLALQQEVDPNLYLVRQNSAKLLAEISTQPSLYVKEASPTEYSQQLDKIQQLLLQRAQENIQRGAQLSPEIQAELVASGLEKVGAAGLRPSAGGRYGAAGPTVARVLGLAGEQLRTAREQAAQQAATTAQQLHSQRLADLMGLMRGEAATQTALSELSRAALPAAGLSGGDLLNLLIQRANALAGVYGAQGQALARQAETVGQAQAQAAQQAAGAWIGGLGKMFEGLGKIFGGYLANKDMVKKPSVTPGVDISSGSSQLITPEGYWDWTQPID